MSVTTDDTIKAPRKSAMVLELRAAADFIRMSVPLVRAHLRHKPSIDVSPVIVIPGFGSDDRYTAPLRHYLGRLGYQTEGWQMGFNRAGTNMPHTLADLSDRWNVKPQKNYQGEASVPYLCDQVRKHVERRSQELDSPVSLIGWSLGGYIAREVARDLPDRVDKVITMGSPTIGGPKYTAAASYFRKLGMDLDWIEKEIADREDRLIEQPITAIYSKTDAIVSWQACIDHHSPFVEHIEVEAAHLGMGFNPTIWKHIVNALDS